MMVCRCSGELDGPGSGVAASESSLDGDDDVLLAEGDDDVPALLESPGNIAGSKGLNAPLKFLFIFAKTFF